MTKNNFIKFFDQISIKDVPQVGGKNASLGEMYCKLSKAGIRVPNGFATTAEAYNLFLTSTGLKKKIEEILSKLDTSDVLDLAKQGAVIRQMIIAEPLPELFESAIINAYKKLSQFYHTKNLHVAVRSSATAEDLPDASFAGQQESFLNISGNKQLLIAVKKCIASLFTNRAISYRVDKGFGHFKIALSVGAQKMIRSDLASSGVMFTIDTETGFAKTVLINSIYGLGENMVQGNVNPDEFYVFKPTRAIISRSLSRKKIKMIYSANPKHPVRNVPVAINEQTKQSISDQQILKLADWAIAIEKHYKRPMDIEWALDGKDNQLYIIQARPETIHSIRDYNVIEEYILEKKGKIITSGRSVGSRIGAGKANRIMDAKDIGKFKPGEVLVTDMTDPDWEPIMKIASAIVTDKGGRTCHAAIISRELGIPCLVGTNNASSKITTGQEITISCAEGDTGFVYQGELLFKINKTNIKNLKRSKTKIMMNIGSPEIAFASSFIPNDGVGLAREEFIINDAIKIHPLALINYGKHKNKKTFQPKADQPLVGKHENQPKADHPLGDTKTRKQIDQLTIGYSDKKQYFVDKLAEGMATIAAAFYPKDVIIRFSDFKTNEYANLIGGAEYEPVEGNPMIGWRGASRYYDEKFKPAFELECKAIKKVREEMKLTNLKAMVPFCRTIEEAKKVIKIIADNGLKQGKNNFELYCMIEIPSNVILAEEFAKLFDGFSIGSNDLTQLTLGVDRDSSLVSHIYNENNQAVKTLIKQVIQVAKKNKIKIGICGQAPSDFPDFAKFLVACGIDSISLNPDTVVKTTMAIGGTLLYQN